MNTNSEPLNVQPLRTTKSQIPPSPLYPSSFARRGKSPCVTPLIYNSHLLLKGGWFWGFRMTLLISVYLCSSVVAPSAWAEKASPTLVETPAPVVSEPHQLFEKAKKAFDEKRYKEAKDILLQLVAKHPLEDFIPRARLMLANLEEDFTVSTKRFQMLAQEYAGQPEGEEAQKNLGARYYMADKYADASENFKELIEKYPKGSFNLESRYWLASSLLAMGQDQKAATEYGKIVNDSPGSPWAPKACLGLGNAYLKMKDYRKAEKEYLRILDQYSAFDEMNLDFFKLAQTYELEQKDRQAYAAYRTLLARYPKALEVAEARERVKVLETTIPGLKSSDVAEKEVSPAMTAPAEAGAQVAQTAPTPTEVPEEKAEEVKGSKVPVAPAKPFHVQIGVYAKKVNVDKARQQVKKAGYPSFVSEIKEKDIPYTYYKVRVGSFKDKASAEKLATKLSKKLKQKTMVVED